MGTMANLANLMSGWQKGKESARKRQQDEAENEWLRQKREREIAQWAIEDQNLPLKRKILEEELEAQKALREERLANAESKKWDKSLAPGVETGEAFDIAGQASSIAGGMAPTSLRTPMQKMAEPIISQFPKSKVPSTITNEEAEEVRKYARELSAKEKINSESEAEWDRRQEKKTADELKLFKEKESLMQSRPPKASFVRSPSSIKTGKPAKQERMPNKFSDYDVRIKDKALAEAKAAGTYNAEDTLSTNIDLEKRARAIYETERQAREGALQVPETKEILKGKIQDAIQRRKRGLQ